MDEPNNDFGIPHEIHHNTRSHTHPKKKVFEAINLEL